MTIGFNYPEFLLLLLVLPLFFLIARGQRLASRIRRSSRRASLALRLVIVGLLVLTLADAQIKTTSDKLATVFLLDSSDSVGPAGKAQGIAFTKTALALMKDNQQGGVIVFGQDALVEKLVSGDKHLDSVESNPTSSYTNIAEAIRIGTALLPGDAQRRLVLASDGNENIDDVRSAAKIAAANGVQIDILPITQQSGPEVSVGGLNVPSNLRQGEQFTLSVSVDSNYAGPARLLILQDGQVISDTPIDMQKGSNIYRQPLKASSKGFINYTARVVAPKDTLEQNNEANAYSLVKGKPRALLVEGHPANQEAANLNSALKTADIDTTVIPPEKFPALTDLTQYDTVVLVDVPASSLSTANMNVLQAYVKDLGKGMVVVGGEESYGLGGYFRTPVEDMLPVELQLPSKLQTPSVAMVLVIDRSGSMADSYNGPGAGAAGIAKIELAKDSAYLAATQLSNSDQVGIVTFDTQAQWQVPLAPMGNPANLVSPIGRIAPGGGTNIYSGFEPAINALKNTKAANKHIILLTDGQDSENISYDALFADANKYNITVSTVGLGEDVNETFLKNIATKCGGRYYFVDDPSRLPKIFARESHLAARSYIVEEPFTPAISNPSPIIKGISAMPQLLGYVGTRAKPTATLALVTGRNEPLLAHWQYGLGRVVAWTSDAQGRWAKNWLVWNDFSRFWSQTLRWTVAENEAGGLQVQTKMSGNRIYVEADALSLDSQYLNNLEAKAQIVSSSLSGAKEEITLKQTAPGHYAGYFIPKGTGSYIVNVQAGNQNGSSEKPVNLTSTIGAVAPYSPEYKQLGTNTALLNELASITGGKILSKPEEAFTNDLVRTTRSQDLWPWLLALAILLLPLDIGIRRVQFSVAALRRGFGAKGSKGLDPVLEGSTPIPGPISTPAVSRLFAAKERVNSLLQGSSPTFAGEAPRTTQADLKGPQVKRVERPNLNPLSGSDGAIKPVAEVIPGQQLEGDAAALPSSRSQSKAEKPSQDKPNKIEGTESSIGRLNSVLRRSQPNSSRNPISGSSFSENTRSASSPQKTGVQEAVSPQKTEVQEAVSTTKVNSAPLVNNAPGGNSTGSSVKNLSKPTPIEASQQDEEGDLTSRLLRAKQRAHEERKK